MKYIIRLYQLFLLYNLLKSYISKDNEVNLQIEVIINYERTNEVSTVIFTLESQNFHESARKIIISSFCMKYQLFDDACAALEEAIEEKLLSYVNIPNSQYERFEAAVEGEVKNIETSRYKNHFDSEIPPDDELSSHIDDVAYHITNTSFHHHRMCIIHACILNNLSYDILNHLISSIENSGLIDELDGIWIINYGYMLSYDNIILSQAYKYRHIHIINISSKTHYFELPTLNIIHKASQLLHHLHNHDPIQILYLHTKGVSYKILPQPIINWTNMMIYFLILQHKPCYHLLRSHEFDAIGCEYSAKDRFFSGNFYWASSAYISSLSPLILGRHSKYDAEKWILSASKPRIYVPFNSGANLNDYDVGNSYMYHDHDAMIHDGSYYVGGPQHVHLHADDHVKHLLQYRDASHCVGRRLAD